MLDCLTGSSFEEMNRGQICFGGFVWEACYDRGSTLFSSEEKWFLDYDGGGSP